MGTDDSYRMIILITEEEMWQMRNDKPDAKGPPEYFCLTRNGAVLFYPPFDPSKVKLMCGEGTI